MWNAKSKPMILPIGMYSRCKQKEAYEILFKSLQQQQQHKNRTYAMTTLSENYDTVHF